MQWNAAAAEARCHADPQEYGWHTFGTLKGWMGASLTRGLKTTAVEKSLHSWPTT